MFTAYAYNRVSTSIQDSDGKSGLIRQLKAINDFLGSHNDYTLSDKVYTDKASGYHGMNIKDDAGLGSFLADCESGLVKAGDMLCVHAIDRLSRLPPDDARALFQRILGYGVKVAIVRWGIIIDKTANKLDLAGDLLLTVGFHLAYMESEQKSKLISFAKQANVAKARDTGKILFSGKSVPRWLSLNADKTEFSIKPVESALIERIFNMKLSGMGSNKIMTKLHDENNLSFGGLALRNDSITRLLKNRRLIGEWQPQNRAVIDGKRVETDNGEPIQNYFPMVISEKLFNAVQASFDQSARGKASRQFNNVFASLMKCSKCGHAVTRKHSYLKKKVYRTYYSCTGNTHRKCCDRKSQHMQPIQDAIIQALTVLDYSQLSIEDTGNSNAVERASVEYKINELTKSISNYETAIGSIENPDDIGGLLQLRNDKRQELSEANTELTKLNNAITGSSVDVLKEVGSIDLGCEESRIKLNHLFKQHLQKIVLYKTGIISIYFKVSYKEIKRITVLPNPVEPSNPTITYVNEEILNAIRESLPNTKEGLLDFLDKLQSRNLEKLK
ncbi:recombinase family protein [Colwellia psychrerythraea]|uniref:Resolvase domain-containing protein n=1 Tax=Colwellia psychrerythraea TaxID=28229 RepID=A0A099L3Q9_COLPS|nr:recombinase family protein [Colwellia psychrerythraea]KGJ97574.1 Resolvase domain-containing protein [Colwellia psychrerythraea]